jgi:pyridoxamine 5'-phosphate oxidase
VFVLRRKTVLDSISLADGPYTESMDPFGHHDHVDPFAAFHAWMAEAKASELNDPNAMSLATATRDGAPSVRIVLMKRLDSEGFAFYTNRESRKGEELLENPHAALCFHWKSLQRQVRVEGAIRELPRDDVEQYFHSRQRMSQIGAWASQQSRLLDSRATLEERTRTFEEQFPEEVPLPPYWTGFVLEPKTIEFWQERPARLHDRVVFVRVGGSWARERLYP